jgi:hypothetical protein
LRGNGRAKKKEKSRFTPSFIVSYTLLRMCCFIMPKHCCPANALCEAGK